ncbi:unnamed protein product, partial [Amoebophrya sp. A120]|eukprot:GSA120T00003841001.1
MNDGEENVTSSSTSSSARSGRNDNGEIKSTTSRMQENSDTEKERFSLDFYGGANSGFSKEFARQMKLF